MSKKIKKTVETNSTAQLKTNKQAFSINNSKWFLGIVFFVIIIIPFIAYFINVKGMALSSHDTNQVSAMAKADEDNKQNKDDVVLWNNRMFSGMPSYFTAGVKFKHTIFDKISKYLPASILLANILYLGNPVFKNLLPEYAFFFFVVLIGGWLLAYALTRNHAIAILGGVTLGWCTLFYVNFAAGHITKFAVIAHYILLLAGVFLLQNRKYLIGLLCLTLTFPPFIFWGHPQISYYGLIILGIYAIIELIYTFKEKDFIHLGKVAGIVVLTFGIAIAMGYTQFFIKDFSKDTTRGTKIIDATKLQPTTTPAVKNNDVDGVGFDYATSWSYGFEEIPVWFIPNFCGGTSSGPLTDESNVYGTLTGRGIAPNQAMQFIQNMPLYWGSEPFVQGPAYFGAIVVFLFVLGLFLVRGRLLYWLLASILLTIVIALGKNTFIYQLFYNTLPLFNKFRAPTMILSITQILFVITGILGLFQLTNSNILAEKKEKALKQATLIVGGLILFLILFGSSVFKFKGVNDVQFTEQLSNMLGDKAFAETILSSLVKDRISLMRSDAIRSLILILLTAGAIWLFIKNKLDKNIAVLAISILVIIDFWAVNKRYLNDNNFQEKEAILNSTFPVTEADVAIQQDKSNFRMVDLTVSMFNDAGPCVHHQTIGGYSPAKLQRYQDIIEYGISYDFSQINTKGLQSANYLNMLNTKYLKNGVATNAIIQNPYVIGSVWFVNNVVEAKTNEDELIKVRTINPKNTAIVHTENIKYIQNTYLTSDSSSTISSGQIVLIDNKNPMHLKYESNSTKDELAVFSEVIYRPNEDWISYIDGKKVDHFRANYILRAMNIPAGKHTIEFKFHPAKYNTTASILQIGNIAYQLLVIGILAYLFISWRKNKAISTTETSA